MRIVPASIVSAVVATAAAAVVTVAQAPAAHADNGASFDFGYVHNRVAVSDDTAMSGQAGRFAIRLARGHYFHWGAEAEEASLSGSSGLPNGAVARNGASGPVRATTGGPLDGNMLGLKLFAGAHARSGRMMFGGDMAFGVRDTWVSSDLGMDVAGRKGEMLLEARARSDFFLSPSTTLGLVASTDLIERRDVSLAAVFALYFGR